jgi:hypothetical protein
MEVGEAETSIEDREATESLVRSSRLDSQRYQIF